MTRASTSLFSSTPIPDKSRPPSNSAPPAVELHTGRYANALEGPDRNRELDALKAAAVTALTSGLELHAGHGLNYQNVAAVARLDRMEELNIGHSIISRAVFVGLTQAVREMKECIDIGRRPSIVLASMSRECPASGRCYACKQ